jgi:OOP family OmpA-OmpF porin
MPLAKTVVALIVLFAVSFSHPSPASAAPSAANKSLYSTADTYSLTLNAGGLSYTGTGSHMYAPLYGVKLGYDAPGKYILDSFGTEASLNYFSSTSNKGSGNTTGYIFRIEEVLPFTPGERLVPFAAVGLGGIYSSSDTSKDKLLGFFNYGAGLKYFLTGSLALRADARHILAMTIKGIDNFELSAGLSYYFGKESPKKPEPVPVANKPEEEQKQKELKEEKEPKDQEQLKKERTEEKAPTQVAAPLPPPPAPSVAVEAPAESAKGKIAPAPTPAAVAETQGIVKTVVKAPVSRELTIEFEFNRSYFDPKYYGQLSEIADFLKATPGSSALIEGHTDSIGSDSYNFRLSKQRAISVKKSLVKFGLSRDRISTKGYGPTRPVADNATSEGRQRNRRAVTIVIVTN